MIVFSLEHATVSICLSVEGVPWGAGNETRYVGRTCQEVSVYNSVANSLHDDRRSS